MLLSVHPAGRREGSLQHRSDAVPAMSKRWQHRTAFGTV